MQRLSSALNTYHAFDGMKHAEDWATWAKDHPQGLKIIQEVERLRTNTNG
jgi:hypothetical protein